MITKYGNDITAESCRHKFGGDKMAEYLYDLAGDGMSRDDDGGDVEAPCGAFTWFGKRILRTDDQGFVWLERYPSKADAERAFEALLDEWSDWHMVCEHGRTWEERIR